MKNLIQFLYLFLTTVASFSQNFTKEIDSLFVTHIKAGQLHGGIAYIQKDGEVAHFQEYGFKSIEKSEKMKKDVIFRIASMSKLITVFGALKLLEQGKLAMDDPIKKFLPQFSKMKVNQKITKDSSIIVDLARDISIKDLMRHTAGFGENLVNDTGKTHDEYLDLLSKQPLRSQPGERWFYGLHEIKILSILIEKVTNKNLQDYLTEALFTPLKMTDTGFYVPENMIDFEKKIISIFLIQNGPFKYLDLYSKFEEIVNRNLN